MKIDDDRDDDDPSFFIFPTEHEAIDWSHVYWRFRLTFCVGDNVMQVENDYAKDGLAASVRTTGQDALAI